MTGGLFIISYRKSLYQQTYFPESDNAEKYNIKNTGIA